jgi:hypothetical protein
VIYLPNILSMAYPGGTFSREHKRQATCYFRMARNSRTG